MSYYGFSPYVPVAKRRAKAEREMNKLRKKGMEIQPVEIERRTISKTFWGNAWCDHIESFHDYENRLPRGRTYVRNGSVCHLAIQKGHIDAIVSGSELYRVNIDIQLLPDNQWEHLKKTCSGQIGSLLDLLGGKLSHGVMSQVCDVESGLFPKTEEIKLDCNCFDWATMCKHVAAVMYGVGARLDTTPEKLFELRGVNQSELISTTQVVMHTTQSSGSRRLISQSAIENVFGIDLLNEATEQNAQPIQNTMSASKALKPSKQTNKKIPNYFSGIRVKKLRVKLGLTQVAFAKKVGVSAGTVCKWERQGRYKLNLRQETLMALQNQIGSAVK